MERDCKPFLFSYHHDGKPWSLTIPCYDWADAEARARLLNLTLDGEVSAEIPAGIDGYPNDAAGTFYRVDDGPSWSEVSAALDALPQPTPEHLQRAYDEARSRLTDHERRCRPCFERWRPCDEGVRLTEKARTAFNAWNASRGGDLGPPDPPRNPKHRPVA